MPAKPCLLSSPTTTLVKISIKTNKPKQTSQHQRTGLHLIKTFSAPLSSSGVPMKTVYACQGSQLALACPPDHQIRVMRANYGRFSVAICNDKGITDWSVNCMAPRSLRIMQDRWAIGASLKYLEMTIIVINTCCHSVKDPIHTAFCSLQCNLTKCKSQLKTLFVILFIYDFF